MADGNDMMRTFMAQLARDGLRTIGMGLATHGYIQAGPGVESFIGAGMTLLGVAWGWWMTTGHNQALDLLKKLTATKTSAGAVAVAQSMAPQDAAPQVKQAKADVAADLVKPAAALMVLLALSFLLVPAPASAQQRSVSPLVSTAAPTAPCPLIIDPLKLCGVLTGKPQDDIQRVAKRIALIADDDINYAMAKAKAANTNGSAVRLQCLQAIADAHAQASGAGLKKADGSDWARPDPAAITLIEDIAELVDNLSPQGKLFTSCAGAAQMFKTNTLATINAIVTGAAAIAAAPIGL